MTTLDWYFAYTSYALDVKEEAKKTRDIILQIGMLVAPENTQGVWEKVRLEEELTEGEAESIKETSSEVLKEKLHNLASNGRVKSSEAVREIILGRKAAHQPIETLHDLRESEDG